MNLKFGLPAMNGPWKLIWQMNVILCAIFLMNVNSQDSNLNPPNASRINEVHLQVDGSATLSGNSSSNGTDVAAYVPSRSGSSSSSSSSGSSSERSAANCGNTQKMVDNCFRDLPPHLMEFLQTSKIAINEQEITSKCNVFRRGMKCFDEYTSRCIPQSNVNILKSNVEGAKKFFTKFCDDKNFQIAYLSHKECFTYIQEDWMHCTKQFQTILTEGLQSTANFTDKFMEFCCARYAYETCIYNSARYKCYTKSASFARDTAKMLSDEKHFSNCRQYEKSMCNGGSSSSRKWCSLWTLWLFIFLMLRLRMPSSSRPSA